jgi:hypothetical protein
MAIAKRPGNFSLEKAKLDLSEVRIQFIIGICCIIVAASTSLIVNQKDFSPGDLNYVTWSARASNALRQADHLANLGSVLNTGRPSADPISLSTVLLDFTLWQDNLSAYRDINLLFALGCATLLGLVTLELTGQLGNRIGAACAIWASALFLVNPTNTAPFLCVSFRPVLVTSLFLIASIFAWLRFLSLRETSYAHASRLLFMLATFTFVFWGFLPQNLSEKLILSSITAASTGRDLFLAQSSPTIFGCTCGALLVLYLVSLWKRGLPEQFLFVISIFAFFAILPLSLHDGGHPLFQFLSTCATAIMLPYAALIPTSFSEGKTRRVLALCGTLFLTAVYILCIVANQSVLEAIK